MFFIYRNPIKPTIKVNIALIWNWQFILSSGKGGSFELESFKKIVKPHIYQIVTYLFYLLTCVLLTLKRKFVNGHLCEGLFWMLQSLNSIWYLATYLRNWNFGILFGMLTLYAKQFDNFNDIFHSSVKMSPASMTEWMHLTGRGNS